MAEIKALNDFKENYPNDTSIVLRTGSGRIIIQSDQRKIEY